MQPIVHGLETEFAGQLVVEWLDANTEAGRAAMNTYGLRGHPSYALVDAEGSVLWTAFGPLPADQLRQVVQPHIQQP
jgi:hypothetical protein